MVLLTSVARENKKVIYYKVFSKLCKSCAWWKSKKGTEECIVWKENHGRDCEINHFQSSGAMESAGAQPFFQSSVDKYNIGYAHYIGEMVTENLLKKFLNRNLIGTI